MSKNRNSADNFVYRFCRAYDGKFIRNGKEINLSLEELYVIEKPNGFELIHPFAGNIYRAHLQRGRLTDTLKCASMLQTKLKLEYKKVK